MAWAFYVYYGWLNFYFKCKKVQQKIVAQFGEVENGSFEKIVSIENQAVNLKWREWKADPRLIPIWKRVHFPISPRKKASFPFLRLRSVAHFTSVTFFQVMDPQRHRLLTLIISYSVEIQLGSKIVTTSWLPFATGKRAPCLTFFRNVALEN